MRSSKYHRNRFLRENSFTDSIEITKQDAEQMISSSRIPITNNSVYISLKKAVVSGFPMMLDIDGNPVIVYNGKLAVSDFGILEMVATKAGSLKVDAYALSTRSGNPLVLLNFEIGLPPQLNVRKVKVSYSFQQTASGFRYVGGGDAAY